MAGILEAVKTLNSLARTLLLAGVVGGVSLAGWVGYQSHHAGRLALREKQEQIDSFRSELQALHNQLADKDTALAQQAQRIERLQQDIRDRELDIERLNVALGLLVVDRRVARLTVLDQRRDPRTAALRSRVEFVELDGSGDPLGPPREFDISGQIAYIDSWVVKFDDDYVRRAELPRAASLVLFRRLFGEHQPPDQGYPLDTVGTRPAAYGSERLSSFEETIWNEFWTIANNPQHAARLGIRAAHGEAPSIRLEPRRSYLLQLRASDGLSIVVEPRDPDA